MPTENRSSNTEMVSVPPYIGLEPLVGRYYPAQCRRCGWVGSSEELTEDDAQCTRDIGDRLCLGDCDELERHDLLNIIQAMAAPQSHPEPIAWMVGTAIWWTKEEAERDAAATGKTITPFGPMFDTDEVERLKQELLVARAQGRAEVVEMIAQLDAETGLDEFIGSHQIGCTGEWGSHWKEDALRQHFDVNPAAAGELELSRHSGYEILILKEERATLRGKLSTCSDARETLGAQLSASHAREAERDALLREKSGDLIRMAAHLISAPLIALQDLQDEDKKMTRSRVDHAVDVADARLKDAAYELRRIADALSASAEPSEVACRI